MSYRIVYPGGEISKLMVCEISDNNVYQYLIASSKSFDSRKEAEEWAQYLAYKHNKEYESSNDSEDLLLD